MLYRAREREIGVEVALWALGPNMLPDEAVRAAFVAKLGRAQGAVASEPGARVRRLSDVGRGGDRGAVGARANGVRARAGEALSRRRSAADPAAGGARDDARPSARGRARRRAFGHGGAARLDGEAVERRHRAGAAAQALPRGGARHAGLSAAAAGAALGDDARLARRRLFARHARRRDADGWRRSPARRRARSRSRRCSGARSPTIRWCATRASMRSCTSSTRR